VNRRDARYRVPKPVVEYWQTLPKRQGAYLLFVALHGLLREDPEGLIAEYVRLVAPLDAAGKAELAVYGKRAVIERIVKAVRELADKCGLRRGDVVALAVRRIRASEAPGGLPSGTGGKTAGMGEATGLVVGRGRLEEGGTDGE